MFANNHMNETDTLSQSGAGSNNDPLHIAVLRTLAYYDTFDYPLKTAEAWRWLYPVAGSELEPVAQADVDQALVSLVEVGKLGKQGAYVFLAGREKTVETRIERTLRSEKLWRRATSTARYLELVPFIRMVAVVNTLAIDNVRPESDIDFLIVTAPNHVWLTRMIVTGIVSMLGYRRHNDKIAGRICLSFYVTTDGLNFESLVSENPDTHFAMWTSQAVPLIDSGTYEKFQAANGWVTKLLPNAWSWDWKARLLRPNPNLLAIKNFYEIFFGTSVGHWAEAWIRSWQVSRMSKNTKSKASLGTTDVIISEDVLKFHEMDKRKENNEKFQKRLITLGLS